MNFCTSDMYRIIYIVTWTSAYLCRLNVANGADSHHVFIQKVHRLLCYSSHLTSNTFFDRFAAALVEVFEQRVLYDVPIHMSHHPLLCEYIHSMLTGCRMWLLRGELERWCIVLLSKEGQMLNTLTVEPGWTAAFSEAAGAEEDQILPLVQLEEAFRAGMVALVARAASSTITRTESNKPHTFRILAQTVEDATNRETAINDDNACNSWVLADPFWHADSHHDKEIFPVKTIQSEALPVRFHIYMENHRPILMTEASESKEGELHRYNAT